ncbi:hypothetical protein ACFFKU_04470 [Kineococcus gynurae]|uniref:Ribosomally synthesized peptide with SipW-like signal peptide n=1 Tax=Kineococcus gynurae TaxID=452979 RepID=A0ABV5LRD6_9ACTN
MATTIDGDRPLRRSTPGTDCPHRRAARRRRFGLALFLVGGGSLLGGGAFAAWQTSSALTSGAVTAATSGVDVLDASGSSFTAAVSDLLPGDYFYRYADVVNTSPNANAFAGSVGTTGALLGNLLVQADRCSVAWTTTGGTSTCSGTTTSLAAEQTIPTGGTTVSLGTITPGAANSAHLRYRFKLSDSAPQSLMGTSSTLTIGASGTLTGGRDRTAG